MSNTAIVQTAHAELIAAAKRVNGDLKHDERLCLERAVELGEILAQLRNRCGRGEWLPALERIGVSQQRASEYMRLAKLPASVASECGSLREALALLKPEKEEEPAPEPPSSPAAAVAEVAPAERYPGDDTEEIEKEQAEEKAAPKNGAPLVDWKDCQRRIDAALRVPDDLARAYGKSVQEAEEFRACMESARNTAKAFGALREKMVR